MSKRDWTCPLCYTHHDRDLNASNNIHQQALAELAGLGIRELICECGVIHDRDSNAAKNILAVGHGRLTVGITVFLER